MKMASTIQRGELRFTDGDTEHDNDVILHPRTDADLVNITLENMGDLKVLLGKEESDVKSLLELCVGWMSYSVQVVPADGWVENTSGVFNGYYTNIVTVNKVCNTAGGNVTIYANADGTLPSEAQQEAYNKFLYVISVSETNSIVFVAKDITDMVDITVKIDGVF